MKLLIIANLFGVVALIIDFIATQKNTKEKIMLCNGLSNTMCIIQYLLLGAYTGAISCIIAVSRNIVFYAYKNEIPLYILIIYLLILFGFNFFFLTDIVSIIPILATGLYGVCLYQSSVKFLKIGSIIVDAIGTIFDFYTKAYVTMAKCFCSTIGSIIGYIRYEKNSNKNNG